MKDITSKQDLDTLLKCQSPDILYAEVMKFRKFIISKEDVELYDIIGFDVGETFRYFNTPPEVFPFGWMGCGGVHYGWVNRTPELKKDDFPVACVSPTDNDGTVYNIAESIPRAFLLKISYNYTVCKENFFEENLEKTEEAIKFLGIELIPNAEEIIYDRGHGRPVVVHSEPGYWFKSGPDNIGVQAPEKTFHSNNEKDFSYDSIESCKKLADGFLKTFPASALYFYKVLWKEMRPKEEWRDGMKSCYDALGRPELSRNVDAMIHD